MNEIKAEAIRAQTPAQAAQVVAAQAAGPNIAAIIGGIIAVLAVLGSSAARADLKSPFHSLPAEPLELNADDATSAPPHLHKHGGRTILI